MSVCIHACVCVYENRELGLTVRALDVMGNLTHWPLAGELPVKWLHQQNTDKCKWNSSYAHSAVLCKHILGVIELL